MASRISTISLETPVTSGGDGNDIQYLILGQKQHVKTTIHLERGRKLEQVAHLIVLQYVRTPSRLERERKLELRMLTH